MNVNIEHLQGVIPKSVMAGLPAVIAKFNINTPLRLAHFLSQCHHESGGFTRTVENLNYSAAGLLATFGKRFQGVAEEYARQPEKIANRAYANRMGNGNEESGEGWKFRGRGFIQLSMRDNYEAFNELVVEDVLYRPDLVATKYPLLSAAFFFDANALFTIADKGSRVEVITALTKRINGGVNGINERIALFNKYFKLLKGG